MESQSNCPPQLVSVIQFLRSSSGPKTRIGALNGKRVDYFKGSKAIESILSPSYVKLSTKGKSNSPPAVKDEKEAIELLHSVIPFAYFLRVDRAEKSGKKGTPREVRVNPQQLFKDDLYYVWFYEGSQIALKLGGLAMVVCMLAGVMFPLWPPIMRLGVWYLSMGVLGLVGLFFGIAIVRLIFWCITIVVLRPGIWIFPNLFEDVGFVDSFIPLWAWDVPPPSKKKKVANGNGKKSRGENSTNEKAGGSSENGKQQAIANLPGAPERVQAPTRPQQAATSAPTSTATTTQTTTKNNNESGQQGPPGATSVSLDDLN